MNSDEENPEIAEIYGIPSNVPKYKIKKLLSILDLLNSEIGLIYEQLYEYDEPLLGSCINCPAKDIELGK